MSRGVEGAAREGENLVREKQRAAASSVFAGFLLTTVKLMAGIATGSLGLLAEAAHSALDFAAAGMTWFAVRTSWRPPDAQHQYGHGKIENLSALAETALLIVTSLWILWEASRRILGEGPEVEPTVWAFAVMVGSIAVDFVRSRDLRRVAEKTRSQALEADALHFSTDIASSSVVILGLLGVLVARRLDWPWLEFADPVAASVVALIVLVLSWGLGRKAIDMLLDRAPAEALRRARRALARIDEIEGTPTIRARQAGDRLFADIEIPLRRELPLAEGQRIAEKARSMVLQEIGGNASVMIQFYAKTDNGASLRSRVATAVAMEGVHAHNITIRHEGGHAHADLHLELAGDLTLGEGHEVADRVEKRILHEVPEVRRVDIHLELHDEEPVTAEPLGDEERLRLEARIVAAAVPLVGDGALHDLMLARAGSGVYLSCHCYVPRDLLLSEAHRLTDRLERFIRQAVPELDRVAVHAEPSTCDVVGRRTTPDPD